MPEPRSFTNIPGQPGEYVPSAPWWEGPAQAHPEGREEAITFPRPPTVGEGYMTPDYSNRALFEKHVFREIGGDPIKLNPRDALSVVDENLPEIFEQFFGGRVVWEDRGRLTKEQGTAWDEVIRSYHAMVLKDAEMKKAIMIDRYNFMMNQFDIAGKEYQNALTKVRARREKVADLKRIREEKAKKAIEPKEVRPEDIKRYSDMLTKIEKTEGEIHPAQIDAINMIAKQIGAPEISMDEAEWEGIGQWLKNAWNFVWKGEKQAEEVKPKIPPKPTLPKPRPATQKKTKPGAKKAKKSTHGKIVKRGTRKSGQRVVQYEDGFIENE